MLVIIIDLKIKNKNFYHFNSAYSANETRAVLQLTNDQPSTDANKNPPPLISEN